MSVCCGIWQLLGLVFLAKVCNLKIKYRLDKEVETSTTFSYLIKQGALHQGFTKVTACKGRIRKAHNTFPLSIRASVQGL